MGAAAAEDLKSHCADGAEILPLQCNIRDRENVAEMMQKTLEKFGKIDGLVNNGGGQFWSPAEHINAKGFNAVVETILTGTWNCIQEAYHQYMGENGGNIVNIVLISSMGMAGQSHSAAAKTAVENYGEHGKQLFMDAAKNIPKGRLGEVFEKDDHLSNDLIPQIIWNLTPGVQYTTGQTIDVCGGLSMYNNYLQGITDIEEWMAERGLNMG